MLITNRSDDILFRQLTHALGACLDYLEQDEKEDIHRGWSGEPQRQLLLSCRPAWEQAQEILRPDLCPCCGFYKTSHPTEYCERAFLT